MTLTDFYISAVCPFRVIRIFVFKPQDFSREPSIHQRIHFTQPISLLYISIFASTVVVAAPVLDRLNPRKDLTIFYGVKIALVLPLLRKQGAPLIVGLSVLFGTRQLLYVDF